MWYLTTYDDKPAIMFFDGETRTIHFADDSENKLNKEYLEWLAQGNIPEEFNNGL